jgi:excisionase family DNA binding protein
LLGELEVSLALVDIKQTKDPQPAAFHELAAAKYLGMNRTSFRELVRAGVIPYARHLNGKARIYLREDLDAYLSGLPRVVWQRAKTHE